MKKPLAYHAVLFLSIMLILNGCGSQTAPPSDKLSTDEMNLSAQTAIGAPVYQRPEVISSPDLALQLLLEGNGRFASGKPLNKDLSFDRRSDLLKNGQHPFAVIVSCSDSRVPPELLFDQALGDLFVIRVAGNVVAPVELGSVEYAVEHLKTPLVVVLGHEQCGAVTAAVQGGATLGSIGSIIEKIKPAVGQAKVMGLSGTDLVEKTSELNILNSLRTITQSPILKEGLEVQHLKVMGLKYDLDQGVLKVLTD